MNQHLHTSVRRFTLQCIVTWKVTAVHVLLHCYVEGLCLVPEGTLNIAHLDGSVFCWEHQQEQLHCYINGFCVVSEGALLHVWMGESEIVMCSVRGPQSLQQKLLSAVA